MYSFIRLLVSFLICFLVAAIGSKLTAMGIDSWYPTLVQPLPPPPGWVFSLVWGLLYALMAISLWIVWCKRGGTSAYWIFGLQLFLNLFWTLLFFVLHLLWFAAVEALLLWISIGLMMIIFHRTSRLAAWLQLPYFLWVGYATLVTFTIAWANS